MLELLTPAEMGKADRLAIADGVPGVELMENAGRAVADAVLAAEREGRVLILCGPGNNGGDGFVAARHLKFAGREVALAMLGKTEALRGDAAVMANRWEGDVLDATPGLVNEADIVVDALFGAGLTRPLEGIALELARATNRSGAHVVAVDMPSGLDGASGRPLGEAFRAATTVTFFRRKPGHLLFPGREMCGDVILAEIGIPAGALETVWPQAFANAPALWPEAVAPPGAGDHKYLRGHVLGVSGGPYNTGAARLAAVAAARAGAGAVTVAGRADALPVLAAHLTSIMIAPFDDPASLAALAAKRRAGCVVIGPAAGVGEETRHNVLALAGTGLPLVLDADALTSFEDDPARLFDAIGEDCILTPHAGEFRRLFPDIDADRQLSKLEAARFAAKRAGAIVLLKGADTVIASPDGTALINENAPPWLATAGSGDVLAGLIAGILARGTGSLHAAVAGAWLHGECGNVAGPGAIAEDLAASIPAVLKPLLET